MARSGLSTSDTGSLTVRAPAGSSQATSSISAHPEPRRVRERRAAGEGGQVGGPAPLSSEEVVRQQLSGGHRAAQRAAGAMAVWCAPQPSRPCAARLTCDLRACLPVTYTAAVQTQECLTDPAFLVFLAVPLPSPVARASGVASSDTAPTSGPGGGSASTTGPSPFLLDASVRPATQAAPAAPVFFGDMAAL